MTEVKRASGTRGSWFAIVDREALPCVHKHWWCNGSYNDPELRPSPKADQLVEAIRNVKKVILTADDVLSGAGDGGETGFTRAGYIAVYSVDDVEFDEAGLRFRFVERLVKLH